MLNSRLKHILTQIKFYLRVKTSNERNIYKGAILFSSFGNRYSDNSKYLYEHLKRKGYKVFYITDSKACSERILYGSSEHYFALQNCNAVCFTHSEKDISPYIPKSKIRINLWHGSPIKKMGFDSPIDKKWLKKFQYLPFKNPYQRWDYILVQSVFFKEAFMSALQVDETKLLCFGLPRNDILIEKPSAIIDKTLSRLGINQSSNTILYAPTFRENDFDVIIACRELKQLLKIHFPETILLIRLHPFDKSRTTKDFFNESVIDASIIEDPQELLLISKTLITDYSSIAFDYASLSSKIILFCPDKLDYKKARGGFYFEPEDLPFKFCTKISEVQEALHLDSWNTSTQDFISSPASIEIESFLARKNLLIKPT